MFKIIVVDDEDKIVKMICSFIEESLPEVEIVATANSVVGGIKAINTHKLDLLLLDIEMPYANGFDLLESLPERNFEVIFITAFNQYGIEAIKANALDYILKPIDQDELIGSIKKLVNRTHETHKGNLDLLLSEVRQQKNTKIKIQTKTNIEYIELEEIVCIEADGNYSTILFDDKRTKYISIKLKNLLALLPQNDFYRVHKSYIIHLSKVLSYNTQDHTVHMYDGKKVPIARNKRNEFLEEMDKFLMNS
jgi:two-component system LytT family response regulator